MTSQWTLTMVHYDGCPQYNLINCCLIVEQFSLIFFLFLLCYTFYLLYFVFEIKASNYHMVMFGGTLKIFYISFCRFRFVMFARYCLIHKKHFPKTKKKQQLKIEMKWNYKPIIISNVKLILVAEIDEMEKYKVKLIKYVK